MFGRRDSEFVVPSAAFKDCSLPIAFMVPDLTDTDPLLIQVLCATISEAVFKELTDQEVVKSIAISSAVASVAFGDVSTDPLVRPKAKKASAKAVFSHWLFTRRLTHIVPVSQ